MGPSPDGVGAPCSFASLAVRFGGDTDNDKGTRSKEDTEQVILAQECAAVQMLLEMCVALPGDVDGTYCRWACRTGPARV